VVAFVFGYFAFRSRIKGVYFSIITQALTYAAMLLFFRNETGFGGNNGFTDFKRILGYSITAPETRLVLFGLSVALLLGTLVLGRLLVASSSAGAHRHPRRREPGHVHRLQPAHYKLFIWTCRPCCAAWPGALRAAGGHHQPVEMSPPTPSRSPSGWPGGRGTLIGPIIGAFVVNLAKSWFTVSFPEYWLFFLGLLFIVVTLFLPQGVVGLWAKLKPRGESRRAQAKAERRACARSANAASCRLPPKELPRVESPATPRRRPAGTDGEASTGHVLSPASWTSRTASSSTWTTSP
jgi:urea transport system permease protein